MATKKPIEIDVLAQEIERASPHWLSPIEKDADKRRKFFDKKRQEWLAKRKRERRGKS